MPLTILGTVALDSIETPKGSHTRILGGSATYASTAASLFSKVNIVSIIGEDFPETHLEFFEKRGISTNGIEKASGKTFHWEGYYTDDMNEAHTVTTDLNVLLKFSPKIPDKYKSSTIVLVGNFDPNIQKQAIEQFKNPKLVVLDTMNFWIENQLDTLKETLQLIDTLVINDQEIRLLTNIDNIIEAMPEVLKLGPKRVIVKKGEHGAIMYNGDDYFICPAFPLKELVDPTGAGDSFAGGFVGYLAQHTEMTEEDFKNAVIIGTLISSFTVQGFSLDRLKTVDFRMLRAQYNLLKSYMTIPSTADF